MTEGTKAPTKVFISYSWDSEEHKGKVLSLANTLRNPWGVETEIDQYVKARPPYTPDKGWDIWMNERIQWAEFVLIICTEAYKRRFEGDEELGSGLGVTWEGGIIRQHLYNAQLRNIKFIPFVFSSQDLPHIPDVFGTHDRYKFEDETSFRELCYRLRKEPIFVIPDPLFSNVTSVAPRASAAEPPPVHLDVAGTLPRVPLKNLYDCDPNKILFIKNVKHPEPNTWAYPLEYMRQTESRTFELMWRASSHGVSQPKAEDLMILHQRARVTHIVEFLDDQVRETDTGSFRWVRAVWLPEQDWNQLPHQKEILGFSPRYADGNTHSLNSPNFPRFREAWSSLEEFQKHIFKRLTQPEAIVTNEDDLTSERRVDYTRLRDLLKAGQWKEADQETADRMCEVMGRQDEGKLREEDVQNFPCRDLRTINSLWVKYSNNHFGFSVQRQIWQDIEATGQSDYNAYCSFGDSVGWHSPDGWKSYEEITFSLESPCGNLPWWGKQATWVFGAKTGPYLSARVDICKISE
ncbi:MAG: GUN4 domain-containing protein [Stenomitos rutilans HA7619-LM2]|nr:GUN4 domain-containing protein [Stenomitos rutilans HA7619-LM2]